MALLAGSATLVWFIVVARPAPSYLLSHNLVPALRQTGSLLIGHAAPRKLYASGGLTSPAWEVVAGFAAITVLLLGCLRRFVADGGLVTVRLWSSPWRWRSLSR